MIFKLKHKQRYKPLYKKFKQVFENVQSRQKILKFNKQKWESLKNYLKKKISYHRKFTIFNHSGNIVSFFLYRTPNFKKDKYKNFLHAAKKFNLFYGGLKKTYIKNLIKTIWKKKIHKKNKFIEKTFSFLDIMEKRLETVLYRSFFTQSIKNARQLIFHGHVFVNNQIIKNSSYILKKNDIIKINSKFHNYVSHNIKKSICWPIQQNNILVNYRTLQILYTERSKMNNFSNFFPFSLNIKNTIKYYKY
jgi:ribosomal protein S4